MGKRIRRYPGLKTHATVHFEIDAYLGDSR